MELSETVSNIKEEISKVEFKNYSWKEFVHNSSGQASPGLYLAFWYGVMLIFVMLPIILLLLFLHHTNGVVTEALINNLILFEGTQVPSVLTFLAIHKATDNATLKINKNKPDTSSDVNLKTTEIK